MNANEAKRIEELVRQPLALSALPKAKQMAAAEEIPCGLIAKCALAGDEVRPSRLVGLVSHWVADHS
ncbi:MAG: hypothetical protein PHO89_01195 [Methylacidiphilaceae bacterium]|nr:hypothetical protein [Candidatus Methylacidiphilaceae bacterium]